MWAPFCDDYTINPKEPKLHRHLCIQCGVIYEDWEEEDGICSVCRDEREEWI